MNNISLELLNHALKDYYDDSFKIIKMKDNK